MQNGLQLSYADKRKTLLSKIVSLLNAQIQAKMLFKIDSQRIIQGATTR